MWHKTILWGGIVHELRLMHERLKKKKNFAMSTFPYRVASDAEQSTQPCKAGKPGGGV